MNNELRNKKKQIFETAMELFAQKGYSNVTVREIASKVGIKASSIYNHYSSKEEILHDVFDFYDRRWTSFYHQKLKELNPDKCPAEEYPKIMRLSYEPHEVHQMLWASRIMINEQFRSHKASELLWGEAFKQYIESYTKFLEAVAAKEAYNRGKTKLYAEILGRISMTFLMQFHHTEMFDNKDLSEGIDNIYKLIFEMIEKYEAV